MMTAALVMVAALVAQAPARDARPPQTDESVNVTQGTRLVVENFAGEVVVRTWDRDVVRVQARHASRAKVNIQPAASVLTVRSAAGGAGSVDYEITAPAWMPLRVQGTFNFIEIHGAQSEVHAETTRGDVVVNGGTGAVTAKSIQGRVIVEGARGRVTASSVNETITISDSGGEISAETTNGDITLTRMSATSVDLSTINGNILYDGAPAVRGRYRFTTHNGNITAVVPDSANVSFIVRTYNGSFASAIALDGPPRSEVQRGRRTTYTLGNGSAEMEMESFGGAIRIRRAAAAAPERKER